MVAGCGAKLSKMVLFVFNSILWLVAIALIALGGYVVARPADYGAFFGDSANTLNIACGVIIAVGCLVFLLAFAGCFGACKESAGMLKIYIAVLLLLVILEIVGGILALVFRNSIEKTATDVWKEQMNLKTAEYVKDKPDFVDTIQLAFKCCGSSDYKSWKNTAFQNNTVNAGLYVPASCCKTYEAGCNDATTGGDDIADDTAIYLEGCTDEVVNFFKDNFLIIGAVALGLVAAEILAMIFACCVISGISNGEYE
ncbi:CD63 antigen-like isoform X1 [Patiria miniata]|uniref:Tetraspanin n=1 Tax=Patiria miniata TaxID=46514 RepID=A0A913ZM64_PATMI|nr:CD63 antigen-like isoform X1 [Patiria miniata]